MNQSEIAGSRLGQSRQDEEPVAPKEQSVPTDQQLLSEYATAQSEGAFAEIVARHARFVYAAALRQTENPTVADEITQAVFVILARKAVSLRRETVLQGWLFRAVRYAAMDFHKVEARRVRREHEAARMNSTDTGEDSGSAWKQLAPFLDEALASLSTKDRHAILLRFFEKRSFRELGGILGGNENSARLRVVRALEKLRGWFQKRGVVLSAAFISSALLVASAQAAPPGLVSSVTGRIASGHYPAEVTGLIRRILRRFWCGRWPLPVGGLVLAMFLALFVVDLARQVQVHTGTRVRATALAIDSAISSGDADGFIACVHFRNPEEELFKPVLAAFVRAAVGLRQQVRETFAAQPVRLQIWLWMVEQLFDGQPRRGQESSTVGRVTDGFFQPYLLVMVKVGSAWKWDWFASLPPDVIKERMRILRENTALCERVTRQIQEGELATAEQALALVRGHSN